MVNVSKKKDALKILLWTIIGIQLIYVIVYLPILRDISFVNRASWKGSAHPLASVNRMNSTTTMTHWHGNEVKLNDTSSFRKEMLNQNMTELPHETLYHTGGTYYQKENLNFNGILASKMTGVKEVTLTSKTPNRPLNHSNIPYTPLAEVEIATKTEFYATTDANSTNRSISMVLQHRRNTFIVKFQNKTMDVDIIQHNANFCAITPNLTYIIYIYTTPNNVLPRKFLRQSWATYTRKSRTIFLVGRASSEDDELIITKELQLYGDIVQGDFIDSYETLTLKGLLGLKWITKYCAQAQFVIKADDDVVANMFEIYSAIEHQILTKRNHSKVLCVLDTYAPVDRNPMSRYYVPSNQITQLAIYPPICLGGLYGYSMTIAKKMLPIALHTPYFYLEDVFFTGFVLPQIDDLNIMYMNIRHKWSQIWPGISRKRMDIYMSWMSTETIWVVVGTPYENATQYWHTIKDRTLIYRNKLWTTSF